MSDEPVQFHWVFPRESRQTIILKKDGPQFDLEAQMQLARPLKVERFEHLH